MAIISARPVFKKAITLASEQHDFRISDLNLKSKIRSANRETKV